MISKSSFSSKNEPSSTVNPPKAVHSVQFYEHDEFLYETVTSYIGNGLQQQEGIIIIATAEHVSAFEHKLSENGWDIATLKKRGQLLILDALKTLGEFMEDNQPQAHKFYPLLQHVVQKLKQSYPRIRAYGEMVDLLCELGNLVGAVALEHLWNNILHQEAFPLLCTYNLRHFQDEAHGQRFHDVCCSHVQVMPTETFTTLQGMEAQHRMIVQLQQKAKVLEAQLKLQKAHSVSTEQALRHEEDNYHTLLSILPVGVIGMSRSPPLDKKKSFVNQRFFTMTGIEEEKIKNQAWRESIHPDDQERVKPLWDPSQPSSLLTQQDYRYCHPNGSMRWFQEEKVIHKNPQGKIKVEISAIVDLTESKRLEKERLEAIQAVQEQQHQQAMEAKAHQQQQEVFIDALCHELRNPLAGLYGNFELLKKGLEHRKHLLFNTRETWTSNAKNQWIDQLKEDSESIEAIEKCIAHQKIIMDDVLNVSKLNAGKVELQQLLFSPKEKLLEVTKMFAIQARHKKIQLCIHVAIDEMKVIGDPDRLSQIIINLLANALKFTEQGSITLRLELLSPLSDTLLFQISIEDTGVGMTPEEQARLFHRFTQASSSTFFEHGGSGLGLFISKNLVELMGGTIQVESRINIGTTFRFTFKVQKACTPQLLFKTSRPPSFQNPLAPPPSSTSILIVEDNQINQRVLLRLLQGAGYTCHLAQHGQEAVEAIQRTSFGLIFMDIQMPVMDGLTATRAIRQWETQKNSSPTPIIGLSGNASQKHRGEAYESGMTAYLTKPIKKSVLFEIVEKFIPNPMNVVIEQTESTLYEDIRSIPLTLDSQIPETEKQARNFPALEDKNWLTMGLSFSCLMFGVAVSIKSMEEPSAQSLITAFLLILSGVYTLTKHSSQSNSVHISHRHTFFNPPSEQQQPLTTLQFRPPNPPFH